MTSYRMSFSEDLLNHFVGSLIEGLAEVESLWFDLKDGSFRLHIHGKRYVNYALSADFAVASVSYSPSEQTIVFRQIGRTDIRGRFYFGEYLSKLVDEPLKDYLDGFEFVDVAGDEYTFVLRRSESMRTFFDTTLVDYKLTELFPFDDLLIRPSEITLVGKR